MKIEDLIKQNKEQFEDIMPHEGHFDRFEAKLKETFGEVEVKKAPKIKFKRWVYAAMSAAALLTIMFKVAISDHTTLDEEVEQLIAYYNSQLEIEAGEIIDMLGFIDAGNRVEIIKDIEALRNVNVENIKNADMPKDEKIYYLYNSYNASTEVLQNIGHHIKSMKNN